MVQEPRALIERVATLCVVTLALAGCPASQTRPSPAMPEESEPLPQPTPVPYSPPPAPARPAPALRENHLSPATRALVTQAKGQLSKGDLDGASSSLDRALRIEPNNPLLWVERGKLRLVEGDARQAESCARKSLALASGDRVAQAQAGKVLADALRAQGRNPEAADVERQPYMR